MKPKQEMICIRCGRKIFPEEHYIKVEEMLHEKNLKTNYIHKSCWDFLMDEKDTKRQALGMLKKVMFKLNDTGLVAQ